MNLFLASGLSGLLLLGAFANISEDTSKSVVQNIARAHKLHKDRVTESSSVAASTEIMARAAEIVGVLSLQEKIATGAAPPPQTGSSCLALMYKYQTDHKYLKSHANKAISANKVEANVHDALIRRGKAIQNAEDAANQITDTVSLGKYGQLLAMRRDYFKAVDDAVARNISDQNCVDLDVKLAHLQVAVDATLNDP